MSKAARREDGLDRLVVFLAKRDGIDKLVKTFQYVAKLAHWQLSARGHESLADRAKKWEVSCGTSRKAFRTGRFLTGMNTLRNPNPNPTFLSHLLPVLANGGEMVYFFFDHLLWLARIGFLDPHLSTRMSFISAFGESFGYIFFIISDLIAISKGLREEKRILAQVSSSSSSSAEEEVEQWRKKEVRRIRAQRVMQVLAIAANLADLVIALADIEPNPFCNHALTLGISGLVSAWSGWYRNWPASPPPK